MMPFTFTNLTIKKIYGIMVVAQVMGIIFFVPKNTLSYLQGEIYVRKKIQTQ